MDFSLNGEQEALADSVRRFTERDYGFDARRRIVDSASGISDAHWAIFAELGWLGAGLSESSGGFGGGAIENAIIAERFGRALVVEPFLAAVLALQTLDALGDFDGRAALVDPVVAGETRLVLAHLEAAGRGDSKLVETEARAAGEGWALTGGKSLVLGAPSADRLLVSARDGDRVGLYLVEAHGPGCDLTSYRTLDNGRVADLRLDCAPATLLASDAQSAIDAALDHATIVACAEAVGAMDAALWMTRDYAQTRQQFGKPIGSFQAYQHRMADMLVRTELARSMLYQGLVALVGPAEQRATGVSAAKVVIGEAGLFLGREAIQLHGGIGMTEEYAIGHYYKRLFVIAHLFGNADRHVERFADLTL